MNVSGMRWAILVAAGAAMIACACCRRSIACALAPVVIIDGSYYDRMTSGKMRGLLETIRRQDREVMSDG